jgi:hypothetical protein
MEEWTEDLKVLEMRTYLLALLIHINGHLSCTRGGQPLYVPCPHLDHGGDKAVVTPEDRSFRALGRFFFFFSGSHISVT